MSVLDSINYASDVGTLSIGGSSLHTAAYSLLEESVLQLWTPRSHRGRNVVIPGAAGTRPKPRRVDESIYPMKLVIVGAVDDTGAVNSDVYEGLQENIAAVEAIIASPTPPTATLSATLTMPDASTLTADVQCGPLLIGDKFLDMVQATFELIVPAGRFA